jgi:hypothetical protein
VPRASTEHTPVSDGQLAIWQHTTTNDGEVVVRAFKRRRYM